MSEEWSQIAANGVIHAATMAFVGFEQAGYEAQRPSVLFRPRIYADGDAWCALLGEDLQSGVCGFGDTPAQAMYAFDRAFMESKTPSAMIAAKEPRT